MIRATQLRATQESPIAGAVLRGLTAARKVLPAWLFYDRRGSELFEAITELPEYYLTRVERGLLEAHSAEIVRLACAGTERRVHVVELGAGSACKTRVLLAALVERQGRTLYVPIDVSQGALDDCTARLTHEAPQVVVQPLAMRHEEALAEVVRVGPRRLVLFIGSSIGNLDDREAVALLASVRRSLAPGGALLVGADRRKPLDVLLPAYDDAQGVTAEFNRNMLARINRELDGHFDLGRFVHRAVWNEKASAVEMHLVSRGAQRVPIDALELTVELADGETIHTETSNKYDQARIHGIIRAAGFVPERDFVDEAGWFGLHFCRVP